MTADVSNRLGMLKGGVEEVKQQKWFSKIDWKALLAKKSPMSYRPLVKSAGDTSNFNTKPMALLECLQGMPPTSQQRDLVVVTDSVTVKIDDFSCKQMVRNTSNPAKGSFAAILASI